MTVVSTMQRNTDTTVPLSIAMDQMISTMPVLMATTPSASASTTCSGNSLAFAGYTLISPTDVRQQMNYSLSKTLVIRELNERNHLTQTLICLYGSPALVSEIIPLTVAMRSPG